jgi:hypothetical protein
LNGESRRDLKVLNLNELCFLSVEISNTPDAVYIRIEHKENAIVAFLSGVAKLSDFRLHANWLLFEYLSIILLKEAYINHLRPLKDVRLPLLTVLGQKIRAHLNLVEPTGFQWDDR